MNEGWWVGRKSVDRENWVDCWRKRWRVGKRLRIVGLVSMHRRIDLKLRCNVMRRFCGDHVFHAVDRMLLVQVYLCWKLNLYCLRSSPLLVCCLSRQLCEVALELNISVPDLSSEATLALNAARYSWY